MKTYSRFSWQQINAQLCSVFCVLTMFLCLFASQYAEAQSQSRSIQHLKGAYPVKHLKKTSLLISRKDLPKSTEIWFLREVIFGGFSLGLDD